MQFAAAFLIPINRIFQNAFVSSLVCPVLLVMGLLWMTSAKAQSFSCDVQLRSFRINNTVIDTKPDFIGNAHIIVDYNNAEWVINYVNNNQKFACSYFDFILEKPNYTGTNSWYMASSVVDGYPVDLDFDQRLIWFAYCARDYLHRKQGQAVIIPFGDTRLDCYVHGSRMYLNWHSSMDLCPEIARFGFDADLFQKGIRQLSWEPPGSFLNTREEQITRYIGHHTNDQTIAVFSVNTWTELQKMNIPSAWQLDLYWYGQRSFTCIGTADNIKVLEGKIALPILPRTTFITDKRVRNASLEINSVRYFITNGVIPSVNDVKLATLTGNVNFAQMPPNLRNVRIVILGLLLALGMTPIAFWFFTKKTNR
jgi:hypothetical protein